jgi:hypothetical protein
VFWCPEGRKYPNIVRDKAWQSFAVHVWRLSTAGILAVIPSLRLLAVLAHQPSFIC